MNSKKRTAHTMDPQRGSITDSPLFMLVETWDVEWYVNTHTVWSDSEGVELQPLLSSEERNTSSFNGPTVPCLLEGEAVFRVVSLDSMLAVYFCSRIFL